MGGFQKNNLFGLIFKKQPIWVDFFKYFMYLCTQIRRIRI